MSASLNLEAYLEHDLIVSDFSVDHMAARLLHLEPFDVAKILAAFGNRFLIGILYTFLL